MRINVDSRQIYVERAESVGRPLERLYTMRTMVQQSTDGYQVVRHQEPLVGEGVGRANAGLVDVLRYWAFRQRSALQATWTPRLLYLPPALPAVTAPGSLPSGHVIRAIRETPQVLIKYDPRHVSIASVVWEIVQSFPQCYIAIVVHRRSWRKQLMHELRDLGLPFRLSLADRALPYATRVVVCSISGAFNSAVELNHRHLLILPFADEATHVEMHDVLRTADAKFRVVGLLPYQRQLSAREEDLLRCVFGFGDAQLPMHGFREAQIEALGVNFRSRPLLAENDTPSLQREGIWRSKSRNVFVARVARALALSGRDIGTRFPDLRRYTEQLLNRRVAVVVANLTQAATLLRYLRGWPLVTGDDIGSVQLGSAARERLASAILRWHQYDHFVVTHDSLDRVNAGLLDVVLWGCGGPVRSDFPVKHLICPSADVHRMTIIDLLDHHHPTLAEWSRLRMQAYRQAEWLRPGESPVDYRIERWLRCRPGPARAMETMP